MDTRIMMEFLLDHIPIIFDMSTQDLKYDTRNIYYKIYKYILDLERKVDK